MPTISIGPYDRVLALGKTRSGKTTLLRRLVETRPYRIVLDTKQDPSDGWIGEKLTTLARVRRKWNKGPIIYQPDREHMYPAALEDFFRWFFDTTQDVTLLVDELAQEGVFHSTSWSRSLDLLYRQGGGRHQPVWGGSQRPHWVKNEAISESEHAFVMELKLTEDRKKVAGLTSDRRALEPPFHPVTRQHVKHSAWYIYDGVCTYLAPLGVRPPDAATVDAALRERAAS